MSLLFCKWIKNVAYRIQLVISPWSLSVPDNSPFALLVSCYLKIIRINKKMPCLYSAFYFQHPFIFLKLVRLTGQELFPPYYRYRTKGLSDSIKIVGGKASAWIKACLPQTLHESFSHHWKLNEHPGLFHYVALGNFRCLLGRAYVLLISQLKVENYMLTCSWEKVPWENLFSMV